MLERLAALGGVGYVVFFVVGLVVAENGQPSEDAAPAKVIAFYSDAEHRDRIAIGWLLTLIGLFFFLWFLATLAQTVRRISGDDFLARATVIGGAVYGALGIAGGSLSTAIKTMSDDSYQGQVSPDLIHAASDSGYVLHSGGGVGAAVMMIAVAVAAMRVGVVSSVVGWIGVVAGISAVFSIFFIPWLVIAVWLVVVSVMLFVAAGRRSV